MDLDRTTASVEGSVEVARSTEIDEAGSQYSGNKPRPTSRHQRKPSKDAAISLIPIIRVSRDEIPLAWLDVSPVLTNNAAEPQGSRFFSTTSLILASWFDDFQGSKSVVLLARDKKSNRLCAVERVRKGEYAFCAIGSWVAEEQVLGPSYGAAQRSRSSTSVVTETKGVKRKRPEAVRQAEEWWKPAALKEADMRSLQALQGPDTPPKKISLSMSRPQASQEAVKDTPPELPTAAEINASTTEEVEHATPVVSKEQIYENLVVQYLEALYLQRTSLAFFTKGPLSRARRVFMPSSMSLPNHTLSLPDLTTFLRSIILKLGAMDIKFKEKLPALAKDVSLLFTDDEDEVEKGKKKRTKKRKLKLSKEGIYPFEEEFVQQWWKIDNEDLQSSAEKREEIIKRRVGELRVRETLLQIILALEVLALEASAEWKAANKSQGPPLPADSQTHDAMDVAVKPTEKSKPKRKGRKELDLSVHLDLLVDKMAIWHSIEYEADFLAIGPAQGNDAMKTWALDKLGAFCIDVIIPFYKSRIPEQVASMVKRFGGPAGSPEKVRKPASAKSKEKDPTVAKDSSKIPQKRSLQRTATESQPLSSRRPPLLSRSATDSCLLPNAVKRESSEKPLSAIPLLRDQKRARRDSVDKLKHLQRRVISMKDIVPNKKRKAAAEEEIKAAIAAIKKPNRGEAGREAAEERERRVAAMSSRKADPRKVLNPRANIQVAATPKHVRIVDVFAKSTSVSQPAPNFDSEIDLLPSSGAASRIPDTEKRDSTTHMIVETPSISRTMKRSFFTSMKSRTSLPLAEKPTVSETIDAGYASDTVFATPVRPMRKSNPARLLMPPAREDALAESPLSAAKRAMAAPAFAQKAIHESPKDIYDALGWNDYPLDD